MSLVQTTMQPTTWQEVSEQEAASLCLQGLLVGQRRPDGTVNRPPSGRIWEGGTA
jgi:hypothetical protein